MKQSTANKGKQRPREYVGVSEAETITSISAWTWRRWAYQGKIASVKPGKRLLIPISEIRRVMGEGYRPALETSELEVSNGR